MPQQGRRVAPLLVLAGVAVVWLVALAVTVAWEVGDLRWVLRSQTSTLVNSGVWLVGLPLGTVVMGVGLAHVLARWRGGGVLAALMLIPSGLTFAVVAVAWRAAFAFRPSGRGQVGVVNAVVDAAGVEPVAWLTQEPVVNTVILCVAGVWALTGIAVAVLVGAMRRIPRDLLDVASDHGAGEWGLLVRIVLPAIRVPLVAVAVASAFIAIATYDIVRVATGGHFGTQVLATESIDQSFVRGDVSRGSALAVVMVLLTLAVMGLLHVWGRRREDFSVVTAVPRHRAEGRAARHSRSEGHDGDGHGDGNARTSTRRGRPARLFGRLVVLGVVAVWLVPVVGLVVTALRPAEAAESSGWWTVVSDPELTLDNLRVVLDEGMWSGLLDSIAIALPVACITGALALVVTRSGPEMRRATTASWVLLAAAPVVAIMVPMFDAAEAVGLDDSLIATWVVHVVVLTPLAVLVATAATSRSSDLGRRVGAFAGAVAVFLVAWNDQVVATVFLDGAQGTTPATVRLADMVSARGEELHLVAAAAVLTALVPVVVLLGSRGLLLRSLVGSGPSDSVPDGEAGVEVEEVEPFGVDRERGAVAESDAGAGLQLGDAHGGAGGKDLVEGVRVAGGGGDSVDAEVDEDLGTE